MWPVLTLTLLLQLTDEEQLYALVQPQPVQIEITDDREAQPAATVVDFKPKEA